MVCPLRRHGLTFYRSRVAQQTMVAFFFFFCVQFCITLKRPGPVHAHGYRAGVDWPGREPAPHFIMKYGRQRPSAQSVFLDARTGLVRRATHHPPFYDITRGTPECFISHVGVLWEVLASQTFPYKIFAESFSIIRIGRLVK